MKLEDIVAIDMVFNKLADVDINKGPGLDNILPAFLGNCSKHLPYCYFIYLYRLRHFPPSGNKLILRPFSKRAIKLTYRITVLRVDYAW